MFDSRFLTEACQIVGCLEDVLRGGPDPEGLAAAAWIHDWTPVTRGRDIPSLYGRISEGADPQAPGQEAATADLLHLDRARGLARTRESWLRLGARADAMRRASMRESFGDGTRLEAQVLREMGEGLWPIEDEDLNAMLDAWPSQMLEPLAQQDAADLSHRLAAAVRAWPDRGRAR